MATEIHAWPCSRGCGQLLGVDPHGETVCATCRALEREPQGETVRLFAPAPPVMRGQTGFPV